MTRPPLAVASAGTDATWTKSLSVSVSLALSLSLSLSFFRQGQGEREDPPHRGLAPSCFLAWGLVPRLAWGRAELSLSLSLARSLCLLICTREYIFFYTHVYKYFLALALDEVRRGIRQ